MFAMDFVKYDSNSINGKEKPTSVNYRNEYEPVDLIIFKSPLDTR